MKKIWNQLKWHVINDFHPWQYPSIALFLIVCIILNYIFDFEDTRLEPMKGLSKFIAYLGFYSFPYLTAVYIYVQFNNQRSILQQKEFWLKSIFALVILALDSSVPFLDNIIYDLFHPRIQFWTYKVMINAISFITILAPILLFYFLYEKNEAHLYGLRPKKFDVKPY